MLFLSRDNFRDSFRDTFVLGRRECTVTLFETLSEKRLWDTSDSVSESVPKAVSEVSRRQERICLGTSRHKSVSGDTKASRVHETEFCLRYGSEPRRLPIHLETKRRYFCEMQISSRKRYNGHPRASLAHEHYFRSIGARISE